MADGGGLAVVHAADNSWPEWKEFNRMIGLGGWGGRNEKDGPYVYYNAEGELVRDPSPGGCGKHGPQNEFLGHDAREGPPDHQGRAGLLDAHQGRVLLDAPRTGREHDDPGHRPATRRSCRRPAANEPMLMTIDYHKGRVFHTTLGHDTDAFEWVGFITTFLRGAEWAATGKVTQEVPKDFPDADKPSKRTFKLKEAK